MKKIVIILLAVFAINIANAQNNSLTKREIKNVMTILVSNKPDYSFIMKENTQTTCLEYFGDEIYNLVLDEAQYIFIKDTIITFQKLNLTAEKKVALQNKLYQTIYLKNNLIRDVLKNGAYFNLNKRRAIISYEDKKRLVDFECQSPSIEYKYLKYSKYTTEKERR